MSRKATNEYIGIKRRAYAQAGRAKRMRILDDVCETTGYERKYANRLLPGSRKFREHKGRGKTYSDEVAEALNRVWREAGCPCLPYFKAEVGRWKIGERPQSTFTFCRIQTPFWNIIAFSAGVCPRKLGRRTSDI